LFYSKIKNKLKISKNSKIKKLDSQTLKRLFYSTWKPNMSIANQIERYNDLAQANSVKIFELEQWIAKEKADLEKFVFTVPLDIPDEKQNESEILPLSSVFKVTHRIKESRRKFMQNHEFLRSKYFVQLFYIHLDTLLLYAKAVFSIRPSTEQLQRSPSVYSELLFRCDLTLRSLKDAIPIFEMQASAILDENHDLKSQIRSDMYEKEIDGMLWSPVN